MKKIIALLTTLILTLVMVYTFYPVTAYADNVYITSGGTYDLCSYGNDTAISITTTEQVILTQTDSGATTYTNVTINCSVEGVNLYINNLHINNTDNSARCCLIFTGEGNNLYLMGSSNLKSGESVAGIEVLSDTELTISGIGDGSLYIKGGSGAAGIGGNSSYVSNDSGIITIESGNITATTVDSGAGIGSGGYGHAVAIVINGGTVKATCPIGGAGIGGGDHGTFGIISITGGRVNAISTYGGAGIGGGRDADCTGTITISGGVVCALGYSSDAYDIGAGSDGTVSGNFILSGDAVVFLAGDDCMPIFGTSTHIHMPRQNPDNGILYGISVPFNYPSAYVPSSSKIITYVSNSDSTKITQDVQLSGYSVVIADSDTFSRDCYTFASWNTQANGEGTEYAIGEEVTFTRDTILYAQWEEIPVTGITIDQSDVSVALGDTYTLTATVEPSNATNQQITWESVAYGFATINSDGVITALQKGTTRIIASVDGHSDYIDVEVWVKVTQVNLSSGMYLYDTMQLSTGVEPNNANNPDVTVTSSDSSILSIDSNFIVTAAGVGTANIYVTTADNVNTTYTITVTERDVTGVQMIQEEASMETGDTLELAAVVTPDDATDTSVTWESSDTDVATVATDGTVTAVAAGSATITATSGGFSDTCDITVTQPITSVNITDSTLDMVDGGTYTLTCELLPSNAETETIYWTSSDTDVATVDTNGKVIATGIGTATITATAGGYSDTCDVTVSKKSVTSVSLNYSENTLFIGEWFTLKTTVSPSDATYTTVTWQSSDTSVATVSATGVVEAISDGTATITATADGVSDTCAVTVSYKSVTSVTLSDASVSMYLGDTEALTATVLPTDAANPAVTWTSSDTSVATVTSGVVKAVGEGSCTITAEADGVSDTCSVYVGRVAVTSVDLSYSSLSMYVDDQRVLTAEVSPSDATYTDVTWESSDESIATVNSNGVVTAVSVGTATITATVDGVSDTCSVTVNYDPAVEVDDVEFIVENSSVTVMYVGDTLQLSISVTPSNATDTSVTWASSDTSILTVSDEGLVTALSVGDATVTVTAQGNASASYKITVKALDDESEEEDVPEDDGDGSSAEPTATPEVVIQEEESDGYLTFDLDVSNLGEDAKYIQLPNDEIIDIEGKDVVSVSILASDLNEGTLEIVTLDEDMVALGAVELAASSADEDAFPWFIVLVMILGAVIASVGGTLLFVRLVVQNPSTTS